MRRKLSLFGVSIVLIIGFFAGSAFSATIGFKATDPSILSPEGYIEVPVCTFFEVDLYIEGLPEVPNVRSDNGLTGFILGIKWDPLVSYEGFSKNSQWWATIDKDPMPGEGVVPETVKLNGYAATVAPAEDHIIGTLLLHCNGLGWTDLTPMPQIPVPYNFALADGSYIDEMIDYKGITIHQTPIPGAVLLFGSGLLGLMGIGRRRMRKS